MNPTSNRKTATRDYEGNIVWIKLKHGTKRHAIEEMFTYHLNSTKSIWKSLCGIVWTNYEDIRPGEENDPICKKCEFRVIVDELSL